MRRMREGALYMTTRTPSDAAPSAIAAPEAKKKRRRRFMHRLPVYFVEHERMVGGSELPQEQAGGHDNTWMGPFAYLEPACLAIARRYACEIAERYTIWTVSIRTASSHHSARAARRTAGQATRRQQRLLNFRAADAAHSGSDPRAGFFSASRYKPYQPVALVRSGR